MGYPLPNLAAKIRLGDFLRDVLLPESLKDESNAQIIRNPERRCWYHVEKIAGYEQDWEDWEKMEMVQYVSRLIYEMQVWMEMFQYVSHKWDAILANKNRLFLMPTLGA